MDTVMLRALLKWIEAVAFFLLLFSGSRRLQISSALVQALNLKRAGGALPMQYFGYPESEREPTLSLAAMEDQILLSDGRKYAAARRRPNCKRDPECKKGTYGEGGKCCQGHVCRDLRTDSNNCGACGHICLPTMTCCDAACADLNIDPNNCGSCGFTCCSGTSCKQGLCGYDDDL